MRLFRKITTYLKKLFSMGEQTPQQKEVSKVALVLKARQEKLELQKLEKEISLAQDQKHEAVSFLVTTLRAVLELRELEQIIQMESPRLTTKIAELEDHEPIREVELVAVGESVDNFPATPDTLRLEVNRLNFPIFALDDKDAKQRDSIKYTAVVERDGQKLEVAWSVSALREFGFPSYFDKRVDTAIQEIINEHNTPIQNPVTFTTADLCKRMGIQRGGSRYEKINKSLGRLWGISITSQGTFYAKGKRSFIKDSFHLYDRVVVFGRDLPDGGVADKNYLWLSQFYLDNINKGYTKPVSLPLYKSFENRVAQRLYEILGVKFYGVLNAGGQFYNVAYKEICQLLPIKANPEHRFAKRQLKKAHDELVAKGYISRVEWRGWTLYYYPAEQVFKELEQSRGASSPFRLASAQSTPESDQHNEIVKELKDKLGFAQQNDGFYHLVAHRVPADVIRMCLADVEADHRAGKIKESKAQLFTHYLKESCRSRGIDLPLKQPS